MATLAQMKTTVSSTIKGIILLAATVTILWSFVQYYSYIFAETIDGIIIGNERVTDPSAIVLGQGLTTNATTSAAQLYSFAIAIKNEKGEIFTSSSEDRQWAVAAKGMCVQAKFLPYPPWQFEKSGSYFGARLLKLHDCSENLKALLPSETPKP